MARHSIKENGAETCEARDHVRPPPQATRSRTGGCPGREVVPRRGVPRRPGTRRHLVLFFGRAPCPTAGVSDFGDDQGVPVQKFVSQGQWAALHGRLGEFHPEFVVERRGNPVLTGVT